MSIIQEALKKVRTEPTLREPAPQPFLVPEKKPQPFLVPAESKEKRVSSKERIVPNPVLVMALILVFGLDSFINIGVRIFSF